MLANVETVLEMIGPNDRVLDIGGAAEVFPRANVVMDILPYEARQRGLFGNMPEQFSRDDWHAGDICFPEIWRQFKDKEFDFVVCSHVLEDVRDPIFVCAQIQRVGKAGYIETPSQFRECAKVSANDVAAGWGHHRWLVEVEGGTIVFRPKMHWVHMFDYLGDARRRFLNDYFFQFVGIHWIGSFDYVERISKGAELEAENAFYFYEHYPYAHPSTFYKVINVPPKGRTLEWVDQFKLAIENELSIEQALERHRQRVEGSRKPRAAWWDKLRWAYLHRFGTYPHRFRTYLRKI